MMFPYYDPQFFGGERSQKVAPHRSLPTTRVARQNLAWQLAALPYPGPEQRSTLKALGYDAVSAALLFIKTAKGDRLDLFGSILGQAARPAQTRDIWRILQLTRASRPPNTFFTTSAESDLERWLRQKGDPSFLARVYFPQFQKAKNFGEQSRLLPYLCRSRDPQVIGYLFSLLRDEKADSFIRRDVYCFIAATERFDVLQWIRSHRPTTRKRSKPNLELSHGRDTDGDGLVDDVDINPYAAPRPLTQEERVMQVAFESRVKFLGRFGALAAMTYPEGSKPFELLGLDGTLVPSSRLTRGESTAMGPNGNYRYWNLGLAIKDVAPGRQRAWPYATGKKVLLPRGAVKAIVFYSAQGAPLGGAGCEVELRKIRGEWFVVRVSQQWVS